MRFGRTLGYLTRMLFAPGELLRSRYENFKGLLEADDDALALVADLQETFYGIRPVDRSRVAKLCNELRAAVEAMSDCLQAMRPMRYQELDGRIEAIGSAIADVLRYREPSLDPPYVMPLLDAAGEYELAGGKGANLGSVAAETSLLVPPGALITTTACNLFLERNGLRHELELLLAETRLCRHNQFRDHCRTMREMILSAEVPAEITDPLMEGLDDLARASGPGLLSGRFAVRSSACAEDGKFTFAGQYESVLNVKREDVLDAYVEVLASKYETRAVTYRVLRGLADVETPMAVLVLPMVDAVAAGVAYTLDRAVNPPDGGVSVHCVPGLGTSLVGGESGGEAIHLDRAEHPAILPESLQPTLLSSEGVRDVALRALLLEDLFGTPQDVEWAVDGAGKVWILQSRPFESGGVGRDMPEPDVAPLVDGLTPISPGAGSGRILYLHSAQDPAEAPRGSVAVFESLAPSLTRSLERVEAVIAMAGGRAGHFATVAREFGVPVVVGEPAMVSALEEGALVTVDAANGRIYPGRHPELMEATEEARRKAREVSLAAYEPLVPLVATLSLTEPNASNFNPAGCKSMHDLVRYIHEKGVHEMFDLVGKGGRGMSRSRKLITELPLTMYVLALDRELPGRRKDGVTSDEVVSEPMRAVWQGLEADDTPWNTGMHHVDWEELDRVSAGIFGKDARFLSSYALVAEDYMHMMIRFGYHFSVLDSVCGDDPKNNYVQFRFKGGGADFDGRLLRLHFIERVLRACGFEVQLKGDMLDGKLSRCNRETIVRGLEAVGRLLGRTRLMDMKLNHDEQVEIMAEEFLVTMDREVRP